MLQIDATHVSAVDRASSAEDLFEALQQAIRLEHATIPPYLLAAYSLHEGVNSFIRRTLLEVAREEMLHMALICNVLNAVGGRPQIGDPAFIPSYPGPLPMAVNQSLLVGLRMYSPELVLSTFMEIEEPEHPIRFNSLKNIFRRMVGGTGYSTIGAFYGAIIRKIEELGDNIFIGDPSRQVAGAATGFPTTLLFPINSAADAIRALTWIVEDGEGTTSTPTDQSGQLSHYYRFSEIHHGRRLIRDGDGYSYTGDVIQFDAAGVHRFPDNPQSESFPEGSFERQLVDGFNQRYCDMLRQLNLAFDGQPDIISSANSQMTRLRGVAATALQHRTEAGEAVAVTFEYMPPRPPN